MKRYLLLAGLLPLALSGCAVNEVVTAEETLLVVAEAPPDETLLLDVGIIQFAPGVACNNEST